MRYLFTVFLILSGLLHAQEYHKYVNPFIGTGGHGHTYPGATMPYGMVQLSPDTRIDGSWDGCSGYHYSDDTIYGFSHTHLSGTGVSDYGDFMLMPTMGVTEMKPEKYSSKFSHNREKASAGYYSVFLEDYDIEVELTVTERVGFQKYTFGRSGEADIIMDLTHRDKLLGSKIRILNDSTFLVYRQSDSWAANQQTWAKIEFDKSFDKITVIHDETGKREAEGLGSELGLVLQKNVSKGEVMKAKISLSFTGYSGAELNSSEIQDWDFNRVKKEAERAWDKQLSKIEVKSEDTDKLTIFYTALYHNMIQPNIFQDLDGKYMGRDFKVHEGDGSDYYTVFSLWDTFRATHPLYTLIEQKRTVDFINTFIKQWEQGGALPVWELAANETGTMIGYHAVSVIADAMIKGIKGFDYEKAYKATKHSAMLDHLGLDAYKEYGFISIDKEHESVSKTLEYAYDDWCIAQMALLLDHPDEYAYYMERAQSWKNLFDPETGLMRPKKNGGWLTPFDGREVNNNYTEGNSWQYSFFVPQDVEGLIEFHGGKEAFVAKLDEMFDLPSEITGRHQVDITGLMGQYAHGNEPSHHMVYLYNYADRPDKTVEKVHYILDEFYKNAPDGLIGNEDCGQMSAWYILSSMGLYSVAPGRLGWDTVEPYFDEIKVNFEDGTSRIISKNTPKEALEKFGFEEVEKLEQWPYEEIVPVPYFIFDNRSFENEMQFELAALDPGDIIYYMFVVKEEDSPSFMYERPAWTIYSGPVTIDETQEVMAYVERGGRQSNILFANFTKRPHDYTIQIHSEAHPLYTAGSPEALLDGIKGTENWRKGDWQGYQGTDFEAVIDLKKRQKIHSVSANFLQDARAWIIMPRNMKVYVSKDGKKFSLFGTADTSINPKDEIVQLDTLTVTGSSKKIRYVKVTAENFGPLYKGHVSEGEEAYIFIDEISIK